ncbi:bifunctional PIG-L family deacetylase/class I SAM-dependent methyltransferase [Herbiconiux sp. KACC 21604]|uniref:bifunctional PIG-L family deacetylase/class I SAM-dependent methyltransferase n=1 Tax=unclassified Herbiconiux TaxID=2618217 RepID=UPI00149217EE|nr:bifunctional PIG-L family deacetylase/class I SAM-dependent methyltransferase [Herbiconiux sp. SALV-R1]QJU54734.1 bifunctional PIG-L family deacetylase/class I SAM-dependent methyltransferase [Herbiconiux sp. SALV-R1]WPO85839.1 bifunctional PIG-L family deacetylase/class I SAM-dependent methyltransferase [Herbiconiux sp. KACC 21604]
MTFSHRDSGTPEPLWRDALAERGPAPLAFAQSVLAEADHLLVVAAHPDDETLGASGALALASAAGLSTTVLVATSGEASHPDSPTHPAESLGHLREDETATAVSALAPDAELLFTRFPDGRLAELISPLADDIERMLRPGARTVLLCPWAGDGHPDHSAAARATAIVAARRGLTVLAYPIWLWHWARPDDGTVPWDDLTALALPAEVVEAKRGALREHRSQVEPLSDAPGDEVLLDAPMLAHFERDAEYFVTVRVPSRATGASGTGVGTPADTGVGTPASGIAPGLRAVRSPAAASRGAADPSDPTPPDDDPVPELDVVGSALAAARAAAASDHFDGVHQSASDPWGFESRWYEERKRGILLATLPERRVRRTLEVGCSTGVLSRELAARTSEAFLGLDISSVALDRARARNADLAHARFERAFVPEEWPEERFDLVVISEIGYYLDDHELERLVDRSIASTRASVSRPDDRGGLVVCCHWRHPVEGRLFSGDRVHDAFRVRRELELLAHHLEEDFVLDVFEHPRPGASGASGAAGPAGHARSVAAREGIV